VDELLAPLPEALASFDAVWAEGTALTADEAFELARSTAAELVEITA
jgi:hypothetical protein